MDTSETGLEKIIVDWLRDKNGYEQATPHDYNKTFALVDSWVERFVTATQPNKVKESMCFASPSERLKFFTRLSGEIGKRGVVDVLRKGYKFNGNTFDLYYPIPCATQSECQGCLQAKYLRCHPTGDVFYPKHQRDRLCCIHQRSSTCYLRTEEQLYWTNLRECHQAIPDGT